MSETVAFRCACGRKLHAPAAAAGRKGRCPACKEVFTVPAPEPEPQLVGAGPLHADADDPFAAVAAAAEAEAAARAPQPEPADAGIPLASVPVVASSATRATRYVPPPAMATGTAYHRPKAARSVALVDEAAYASTSGRRYLYFVLLLVLIPLGLSTLQKSDDETRALETRLIQTIKHHPEIKDSLKLDAEAGLGDVLDAVIEHTPDHRLDGALLAKNSWAHWGFAFISGAAFVALALLVFPPGHAKVGHLCGIALFTGTVGIFLLLAFQWLAFHMPLFRGRGVITLVLDLIWLIGQSYRMALGDHGFFLSFLGFTAGVGLCEEICKALPVIMRAHNQGFSSWRQAMLWGLLSGVGFGASEGITYASDYYNGISGPGMYWVRFVSCVGLHAIWSAAVGIAVFRQQDHFRADADVKDLAARAVAVAIIPMILHGLYDTLLKQGYDAYALLVALVSFGYLAFQIERATRTYDETGLGAAMAGA